MMEGGGRRFCETRTTSSVVDGVLVNHASSLFSFSLSFSSNSLFVCLSSTLRSLLKLKAREAEADARIARNAIRNPCPLFRLVLSFAFGESEGERAASRVASRAA